MKLKNQTELLQMCYEKNIKIADLEKENDEISRKANEAIADKLLITAKYNEILNSLNQEKDNLQKENAELKEKVTALENANRAMIKELDDTTSCGLSVLENVVRSKEQLTKAKEILNKLLCIIRKKDVVLQMYEHGAYTDFAEWSEVIEEVKQFLKE